MPETLADLNLSSRCKHLLRDYQEEVLVFHDLIEDEMSPGKVDVTVRQDEVVVVNNGNTFTYQDERARPVLRAFCRFTAAMEAEGHEPMQMAAKL